MRQVARIFFIASLAACQDDPSFQLSSASDDGVDMSPEAVARRARMNVTVHLTEGSTDAETDVDVRTLASKYVLRDCFDSLADEPGGAPFTEAGCTFEAMVDPLDPSDSQNRPNFQAIPSGAGCSVVMCRTEAAICVANRLLELSTAAGPVTFVAPQQSPYSAATVVVPPQDEESLLVFSEEAYFYASWAVTVAAENLRIASGHGIAGVCTANDLNNYNLANVTPTTSHGEHLASNLGDATALADEAATSAARHHQSVSDADYARSPDISRAAKFAWVDADMSKGRAAHLLGGGFFNRGIADYPDTEGVCPTDPPNPETQKALDLIRAAAPKLSAATDLTQSFSTLYASGVGGDTSLRARLEQRFQTSLPSTSSDFLSQFGLREQDMIAARAYLKHEAKAFARDTQLKQLPAVPLSSERDPDTGAVTPHSSTIAIYAATATPPTAPPSGYFRGLARFAAVNKVTGTALTDDINDGLPTAPDDGVVPSADYARKGLAQLHDYSSSVAIDLTNSSALSAKTLEILAVLAGSEPNGGRVEACYRYHDPGGGNVDEIRFRSYGFKKDHVKVVGGVSGLRCAVNGNVEGADCSLTDFPAGSLFSHLDGIASTGLYGHRNYVETVIRYTSTPNDPWIYVLQHDESRPFDPGTYESIASMRFVADHSTPGPAYRYCTLFPKNKRVDDQVEHALAPSQANCGRAERTCAGADVADRIPLESELSSDSNPFESSWRTYLDRAEEAANRADQLGEQLIEAGLEMDRRIEAAEEALEGICGGAVSLSDYVPVFGTTPARGPSCMTSQEGQACTGMGTSPGMICRDNICVVDGVAAMEAASATDPMAAELAECLGQTGVYEYVTLSASPMCIWVDSSGTVCAGADPDECPTPKPLGGSCPAVPMGMTAKETIPLGLFDPPEEQGANSDRPDPPCVALRALRNPDLSGTPRTLALEHVAGFFNMSESAESTALKRGLISRIDWIGRAGDHAAVTLDGRDIFTTGSSAPDFSPSSWPCSGTNHPSLNSLECLESPSPSDPALARNLFCANTASSNCVFNAHSSGAHLARARLNHRLGRAVLTLRILAGVGVGEDFRGPYLPDVTTYSRSMTFDTEWDAALSDSRSGIRANKAKFTYVPFYSGPTFNISRTGTALCFDGSNSRVWTDLDGALAYDAEWAATCGQRSSEWLPIFRTYSDALPGGDLASGRIWEGLDGATPLAEDDPNFHQAFRGLARGLLEAPPDPATVWIKPDPILAVATQPYLRGGPVYMPSSVDDLTEYWDDGNRVGLLNDGIRVRDILDAMELACEVERIDRQGMATWDFVDPPAPTPSVLSDLAASEAYLRWAANRMLVTAQQQVFVNVPKAAVDGLVGTYQFSGHRGKSSGDFGSALAGLAEYQSTIERELEDFASDMRDLKNALRHHENDARLDELRFLTENANAAAGCTSSIGQFFTSVLTAAASPYGGFVDPATPLATCGASLIAIRNGMESLVLTDDNLVLDNDMSWETFKRRFRDHVDVIQQATTQLERKSEELRGALGEMETDREKGVRALGQALMQGTDASGRQFHVNTVMRRRYNTLQVRYTAAKEDAIRMAWVARRAIEQHLALELDTMTTDMAFVGAPAYWASDLCTMTGIDYSRIHSESPDLPADNFAGEYIGDYVRKLRRVVDSYEHDYPFTDSQDTAVISVRDDIARTREICETNVPNLLAYSAQLDVPSDVTATNPVWEVFGCTPIDSNPVHDCIAVTRAEELLAPAMPLDDPSPDVGAVPGYQITFAPGWTGSPAPTSLDSDSALVQTVDLLPGYYRLSWYGLGPPTGYGPDDAVTARILTGSPATWQAISDKTSVDDTPGYGWTRYHFLFRVATGQPVQIAIVPNPAATAAHSVTLAGLMLEDVGHQMLGNPPASAITPSDFPAGYYVATEEAGIGLDPLCEDTDGDVFRTKWTRGCKRLCVNGFSDCADGEIHCYWEIPFAITIQGIETGGVLQQSGFAYGNYNYRTDGLAVNFVGTGVRDCSRSMFPSTCYGSGSLPYSIVHGGDYEVRNYTGDIYKAPLFEGHIEHGRGLAAERYLTNPISSADRSLLQDYWHHEFRGRPVTGSYKLRIWDSDGVFFDRLEDVQVILDYRYWTRFE